MNDSEVFVDELLEGDEITTDAAEVLQSIDHHLSNIEFGINYIVVGLMLALGCYFISRIFHWYFDGI